jgi:hypothetical protein
MRDREARDMILAKNLYCRQEEVNSSSLPDKWEFRANL